MKRLILPTVLLIVLLSGNPVVGNLNIQTISFSNTLKVGNSYEWNVDNYQVGNTRIETKSSPTSFELIHGTDIELSVLREPSGLNLVANGSLSNQTHLDNYFSLTYDDISYDFDRADQLYIWVFPVITVASDGSSIDILKDFWIYNLYNILKDGESLAFNSTLPEGTVTSSAEGQEQTITLKTSTGSLQAKIDNKVGIMNSINFVSNTPDFRIEISRGSGSSALPVSPVWSVIPLIALPLVFRKFRSSRD